MEKFNSHFSNVGKFLASGINNVSHANDFHSYLKSPCSSSIYFRPTSPQEITKLIYDLHLNKARGYDGISPFILKTAAHIISLALSIILNQCIFYGVFPNKLKVAKVIPIYKSGCPNEPGNYRPISLLSCTSKIFERVIFNRMVSFLERNNLIISTQFGFRHKHSTIHPILDLITESYQNIEEKRFSTLLLLDIRKAFDSVPHPILLKKLEFYGIRGIPHKLLDSYLSERKQFVSIDNIHSQLHDITYGVPQGSILGPLLFLLYINDLPTALQTTPRLFADDTALLISNPSFSKMESLTASELSSVSTWMASNGLTLHPNKTFALNISSFSRKPCPFDLSLTLNNVKIETPKVTKYLGILIDDKLTFKSHIHHLESKLSRSVGIIARLKYFLPSSALINLYFALIHSHLLYGLPVWASTCKTYLSKIKVLQNKAISIISEIPHKERVSPYYYKLQILKLDDLYQFELAKIMHQYTHNKLPIRFCNYFTYSCNSYSYSTRNSSKDHLLLPRFTTTRTQKSIKYKGAKLWNSLPETLRHMSYRRFKSTYKSLLLEKYVQS